MEAMNLPGSDEAPAVNPEEQKPAGKGAGERAAGAAEKGQQVKGMWNSAKAGFNKARNEAAKKAGKTAAKTGVRAGTTAALTAAGTVAPGVGNAIGFAVGELAGRVIFDKKTRNIALAVVGLILLMIVFIIWLSIATISYSFAGGLSGGTAKNETDFNNPAHVETINTIESYTKQTSPCCTNPLHNCSFKRLEFADPKDLELIKEGQVDYRILLAIKRLTMKNDHIKISHVMHLMSVVPANTIETHSDVDHNYVDNISAHKDGMAFDVVEIGCVYKLCECSKECGCDKIPVQVAWQDKGNNPGIARDAGIGKVTELLGLPDGALDGHDANGVFDSTGRAELERQLRIFSGTLENVGNLQEFVEKYGKSKMEAAMRLPPGTLRNQDSLAAYASEAGRRRLEQVLRLAKDSLRGSQPRDVERNTGQKSVEEELNIPSGWLTNKPRDAYDYLAGLGLTNTKKQQIEQSIGWPRGTIDSLLTDLRQGDVGGVKSTLTEVGKDILEQAIGLRGGNLDSPGTAPFSDQQGEEKDAKYGLPIGTFTKFVESLKNNQSINPNMISVGGKELEEGLGLISGGVEDIIYGRKSPGQVENESEDYSAFSNSYIASKLGISEEEARALRSDILNGRNVTPRAQSIGISNLEEDLRLTSGSLDRLVNGSISSEEFLRMNSASLRQQADALGIPPDVFDQLFAGDISGAAQTYGKYEIAQTFGFDIDKFMAWAESGNLQAIIENEVIQVISDVLGIDAGIIGGLLTGNVDPAALIDLGFSMLFGGPLGGIFGGIFGGLFGSSCDTDCWKPEARKNVRAVISELLNMGKSNDDLKPSQIITYRDADVNHFSEIVDQLYGTDRQPNYGLFSRDEMLGHIHVGY